METGWMAEGRCNKGERRGGCKQHHRQQRQSAMTRPIFLDDASRPSHHNSRLHHISRLLLTRKRIILVTGAGISTNSGIPDFRSQSGLYSLIRTSFPSTFKSGKDLFDASVVFRDPEANGVFYRFIGGMKEAVEGAQTGKVHRFCAELRKKGSLMRWYTQNIDELESKAMEQVCGIDVPGQENSEPSNVNMLPDGEDAMASQDTHRSGLTPRTPRRISAVIHRTDTPEESESGFSPYDALDVLSQETPLDPSLACLSPPESQSTPFPSFLPAASTPKRRKTSPSPVLIQLHGTLNRVHCTHCSYTAETDRTHTSHFLQGVPPPCPTCTHRQLARSSSQRRSIATGTLRPSIILYNEIHPQGHRISSAMNMDARKKPDLILILGTSLRVHGCKGLVKALARKCVGDVVFVNNEGVAWGEWGDIVDWWVRGNVDEFVDVVKEIEAKHEWKKRGGWWKEEGDVYGDMLGKPVESKKQATLTREGKVVLNADGQLVPDDAKMNVKPNIPMKSPSRKRVWGGTKEEKVLISDVVKVEST